MRIALIIMVIIVLLLSIRYYFGTQRAYKTNKVKGQSKISCVSDDLITEDDLSELPELIAKYLRYVGVVGKKQVDRFELFVDGQMRLDQNKDWAQVHVEQTTFLVEATRLFYIVMSYKGLQINGIHHYENGKASMVIKILDLIKVVDERGPLMDKAETVTHFNDLCLFAPSALIGADILWEEIDELSIKGTFTNEGISVSAVLYFAEDGRLINFISNDRYAVSGDGEAVNIPWSTPVESFSDYHGYNLVSKGEAIWHYPEGDFSYIRLNVKDVIY